MLLKITKMDDFYRRIDDDMRAAMAIDWIAREKENPGRNSFSSMAS